MQRVLKTLASKSQPQNQLTASQVVAMGVLPALLYSRTHSSEHALFFSNKQCIELFQILLASDVR